jgi:hypothetical protein
MESRVPHDKIDLALRIGVFLVAFAWFSFTFYELVLSFLHTSHPETARSAYQLLSETAGSTGIAFRTAGGFVAFVTSLFYVTKRGLSKPEALTALRFIVAFEAVYWFSLFFSILPSAWVRLDLFTLVNNVPCTVESIALPVVLGILFVKLTPEKAGSSGVKWALISGTVYIFVFWLNNTVNWVMAVLVKGVDYLLLFPANLFSFGLTTLGLLGLTLFVAVFSWRSIMKGDYGNINLRTIGWVVTCFGLYFIIIFVMYLFLGAVGGWGTWYAWFMGHNMDLWLMVLPLAGLPLMMQKRPDPSANAAD